MKLKTIYHGSERRGAKSRRLENLKRQDEMAVKEGGLVRIPMTRGLWVIVDESDYELVKAYKWYPVKCKRTFYAMASVKPAEKKIFIQMHRLIMNTEKDLVVDHKDRNGLNNSRSNLRNCTMSDNRKNAAAPRNSNSGIKGIRERPSGRFQVIFSGEYLGMFETKAEAILAYNQASLKSHGEFAYQNKLCLIK